MTHEGQCDRDSAQKEGQDQQPRCNLGPRVHCELATELPQALTVQFYPTNDGGEQQEYRQTR
jgi:hypothetical protein